MANNVTTPLLRLKPEELKNHLNKRFVTSCLLHIIVHSSQYIKNDQLNLPVNKDSAHICAYACICMDSQIGKLFALKQKDIFPFVTM